MIKKFKVTVPTPSGPEKRWAYVYLPAMYRRQSRRRFPVLYMFDGHNVFFDEDATYGKSWGMGEYLDFVEAPLIVAAVECNHSPEGGRLSEYSPFDIDEPAFGRLPGLGRETMEWFTKVFKPHVDRRYRTLRDREHTFISGSSMGGLMSLYAAVEYNHVFSRAAALSPSVWVDHEKLIRMIRSAHLHPDTVVYMDYGAQELSNHRGMAKKLRLVADALFDRGVMINARVVPGGDHSEASWEKQLPFVVETLLYDLT